MKPAPGTWGSLAALPVGWLLLSLGGPAALIVASLALFGLGIWAATVFFAKTGRHDVRQIVVDEVVGQWLPLLAVGALPADRSAGWLEYLLAFALFRLFDVVKPWPIGWLDRHVHGGVGVMLDDIVAGLFALACVWLLALYWWPF